ncbi:DUF4357 domain-containing protein [Actinopolyspora mortivallis]|uniref:DUF4357 domain-containing protein n=1 Tax=Actinopolyspora mortivallis TaxID=33906 RepID=A0A2T0H1W2_ACTMO|nr:DUF4357 domain-containing protein [Actinopolyspora mortivallis]PRW65368.1 DUF4357 domain-containing protein [Actinopolyspora mortivallis]
MAHGDYPDFQLKLPHGGPRASGRLLADKGTNGSQQFLVLAGSPVRSKVVPSFSSNPNESYRLREDLIEEGVIVQSDEHPGYYEFVRNHTFGSPSSAASVILGSTVSGYTSWKTTDERPLGDFLALPPWGPSRAWLVRGSNVFGWDLVQRLWLREGLVSLAATHLREVDQLISKEELRTIVDEDYEGVLTYNQRQRMIDELYLFLARMKPGDRVCTISEGALYLGEITGDTDRVRSEGNRSNLRRPVSWNEPGFPYEELPEELQQKLSIQLDVVDLTPVKAYVDGLGRSDEELAADTEGSDPETDTAALMVRRELELPEPTDKLANDLLVHDVAWLREIRELLWDDKQLVFHGPPGTGKTYLALKLAEFFGGGPEQVSLVQFHPSYSYEDFFEGFRPREDPGTREVAFRLQDGPLRELADHASLEGNRHLPHFLVIDEINRANLAKVFGELYFLLEYRNRSVRLTYSGDDFALPPNLFIIGTMNTADRSIALVDAAMRRRFSFVELSPSTEPTRGLLRRWLAEHERESEPADLLDELNRRIPDPEFRIGPSYLMNRSVYREGGLERTWRTKILPLLEEHHYGEGLDVEHRYGLAALCAALGNETTS